MRRKVSLGLLAAVFALTLFAGCKSSPEPSGGGTLPVTDMAYKLADNSDVEVTYFDFGDGKLENAVGNPVPCPLDGIIAAPKGPGPYPLVVIFHGVKRVDTIYDKVYSGFDYLVGQLAAEGYVALSFNVNIDYHCWDYGESMDYDWAYTVYKQQMALLERANAGLETGHGVDLKGKIDFSQVHFMGHSRGGEMADCLIRRERREGLDRVRSLVRIASTALEMDEPNPDIPTGIIIAEFDGDVPEDGQRVFDEMLRDPGRESAASIVYLRGANHAYFNRMFTEDDGTSQENRLTREQQEDFMLRYAAAFLSVYARGEGPWGLWDSGEAEPSSMFGYAVTASYAPPDSLSLISPSEGELASLNETGAVSVSYLLREFNDGLLFQHPGALQNMGTLPLYSIRWTGEDGAVSFPCPPADFSAYSALSLYVAVDSSDELSPQALDQSLTVALRDASGAERRVLIPKGTGALTFHGGSALDLGGGAVIWQGFMPLGELRVPLSYFDEIDLGAVSEIVLSLDQTSSGALMLSGISLAG